MELIFFSLHLIHTLNMSEENTPVKLDNADLQQILVAVFIILVTLGKVERVRLCGQLLNIFFSIFSCICSI